MRGRIKIILIASMLFFAGCGQAVEENTAVDPQAAALPSAADAGSAETLSDDFKSENLSSEDEKPQEIKKEDAGFLIGTWAGEGDTETVAAGSVLESEVVIIQEDGNYFIYFNEEFFDQGKWTYDGDVFHMASGSDKDKDRYYNNLRYEEGVLYLEWGEDGLDLWVRVE